MELTKNIGINEYGIEIVEGKQPLYSLIYAFSPLKLETLKVYIEINRKTLFIWPSKSLIGALILFNKKLNYSLYLYVDY